MNQGIFDRKEHSVAKPQLMSRSVLESAAVLLKLEPVSPIRALVNRKNVVRSGFSSGSH
jgi:hypothetical protein